MNFVVTGIRPERREVRVKYGPISLTCRVLDTNGLPYVQKPPYIFIDYEDWKDFVNLVRTAWGEQANDKGVENGKLR